MDVTATLLLLLTTASVGGSRVVPPAAPQNFTATDLRQTSVRLSWDPHLNQSGDITKYQITIHKLSDPFAEKDFITFDPFAYFIGLDSDTFYTSRVRAYNRHGPGQWGNRLHFRTRALIPTPKNVLGRHTSESTIEVTWDEPETPVSGYKIFYNVFATPAMYLWSRIETGPYTVAHITGLGPGTVYAVRVQAKSLDGRYGNLSEIVTTDGREIERSNAVQKFRVTHRRTDLIKLSWEKPKRGDVTTYMLRYEGKKTYREEGVQKCAYHELTEVKIPPRQTTWSVTNLKTKMKYVFNISAVFKSGEEGPQKHTVMETLLDAPPSVEPPIVLAKQNDVVLLQLSQASEVNGPISHYHIVVVPFKSDLTKMPSDYADSELMEERLSVDKTTSDPYIAAKFVSQSLPPEFYLGDSQEYGSFSNRPLDVDDRYRVFLRAYSVDQRLYTSSDFSEEISSSSSSGQAGPSVTNNGNNGGYDEPITSVPTDQKPLLSTTPQVSPPENVQARALNSSTVTVWWGETKLPSGAIQGYTVYYTHKPENPIFFWKFQDVENDIRSTTISGLTANVTYTIGVSAYSDIDRGPLSYPIQILTQHGEKGRPYEKKGSVKSEADYGEKAGATITTPGEDCIEGLQQCTNIYLDDVMEHARFGNTGMVCQDLNIFIKCYVDLECGLQEEQKNSVIERVKQELVAQGFYCDVSLEGVSTRKPKTTITPEYTTKPTTCLGATQVCTKSYINEAFEMARDRRDDLSWFCPLVNKFVACLTDSPCRIHEIQNVVIDKIEAELKQRAIDCDVSLDGVSTGEPNTTIGPEYTTEPTKYIEDVSDYDELTTNAMTAQIPLSSTAPHGQQPPEWVHHIFTALEELQEQLATLNSKVDILLAESDESIEN